MLFKSLFGGPATMTPFPAVSPTVGTVQLILTDGSYITGAVAQSLFGSGGTAPAVPGQVTGLAAGTPASTTVPLSWTAPGTGGATASYLVEYQAAGGAFMAASSSVTATSYTVSGLIVATTYAFRVTASNAGGAGTPSATASATTAAAAAQAPGQLTNFASTQTATSLILTWVEPGGTPTTRAVNVRTPSGTGTYAAATLSAGPTSTGATVSGLTAATSYDVQVVETNATGSSTSTLAGITTSAAGASGPAGVVNAGPGSTPAYVTGKFGSGAMSDGAYHAALTYAGGTITVEAWFKAAAPPSTDTYAISDNVTNIGFQIKGTSGNFGVVAPAFTADSGKAVCDGAWHHIAMVSNATLGVVQAYVDGAKAYEQSYSYQGSGVNPVYDVLACSTAGGGTKSLNNGGARSAFGTLDEVRISSVARYTGAYTVPAAAFTYDASTLALWHLDGNLVSA